MSKISIIIPVYNVEKYIERCARSLFNQTLYDLEYLFIDDCTPDKSIEILHNILSEYPHRVPQTRIIRMPTNSGQAAVRKLGTQLATGEYIIHCDSDDWIDNDMYSLMYDKAVCDNCDIVVCKYFLAYDNELKLPNFIPESHYRDKVKLLSDLILPGSNLPNLWSKLVKRDLYINGNIIFPKYNMAEDMVIMCQLFTNCKKIGYIDIPLYYYYQNAVSISNAQGVENEIQRINQIKNNFNIIINFLNQKGFSHNLKDEIFIRKCAIKDRYLKYIKLNKVYKLWYNTYPEVNIISIPSIKGKLKYLLIVLKLLPILMDIRKRVRNLNVFEF